MTSSIDSDAQYLQQVDIIDCDADCLLAPIASLSCAYFLMFRARQGQAFCRNQYQS